MYSGMAYLSVPSDSNMVLSTLPKNVIFAEYALYSLLVRSLSSSEQRVTLCASGHPRQERV